MRGAHHPGDHHQAILTSALPGWPGVRGRALIVLACLGVLAGSTQAEHAQADPGRRIHLPTEADAVALAPNAETLLYGALGIETKLPGPAADSESITVDLGLDGRPDRVRAVQRLTLSGVGDFSFKVPGPASNLRPLPESGSKPGLRKGSVLWQGFSPGRKLLAVAMDLSPDLEAPRLPLRFAISLRVAGRLLRPGEKVSGPLDLSIRVLNTSAIPVKVTQAKVDAATTARLLDRIRSALASGRRPRPGERGLPAQLAAGGDVRSRTEQIEAPFRIDGEISFPVGALSQVSVDGATASVGPDGTKIGFHALLGGGEPTAVSVRVRGMATSVGLPTFRLLARPDLPSPRWVRPPGGASWTRALAARDGNLHGYDLLAKAMDVLWRVARLRQYDGYLGNPDPTGPAQSTYLFRLAPAPAAVASVTAPPTSPFSVPGAVGLSLAGLVMLFALAMVWARS
jgi:hypothetical protein